MMARCRRRAASCSLMPSVRAALDEHADRLVDKEAGAFAHSKLMREVLARGLPACHSLAEAKAGVRMHGFDLGGPMTQTTARFELPGFKGTLIHPGDSAYDDARKIFNGMIDRRPVLIARCTCADDVVAAVNLAASSGFRSRSMGAATG